jgi:hypothetical protein
MIPTEVARIADQICPGWSDATDDIIHEVLQAAWRVYNAGYRLQTAVT